MVDDGGDRAGTDGTGRSGVARSTPGLEERIKRLPLAGIFGSAAVILVVGLLLGLAAGYKIEQTRVKNDVRAANARASKSAATQPQGQPRNASVQFRGKVASASANGFNLTVGGATKQLLTDQATIVVKTTPGTPTDIAAGVRVVWKSKKGQPTQADEVIVLPANAKTGTVVVSATANSMTLKSSPNNVTVSTNGATVEKVTTAKATDIATGAKVVVQARQTNVLEVIVLSNTSKLVL
jgi:hypothetical protein